MNHGPQNDKPSRRRGVSLAAAVWSLGAHVALGAVLAEHMFRGLTDRPGLSVVSVALVGAPSSDDDAVPRSVAGHVRALERPANPSVVPPTILAPPAVPPSKPAAHVAAAFPAAPVPAAKPVLVDDLLVSPDALERPLPITPVDPIPGETSDGVARVDPGRAATASVGGPAPGPEAVGRVAPATGDGGTGDPSGSGAPASRAYPLATPVPDYPLRARRQGLSGRVVLRVDVGEDGRPDAVRVERSSGHAVLDRAAEAAVLDWRFAPARRDGKRVRDSVEVPISFRLAE